MGSKYRGRQTPHWILLQPLNALLTAFILERYHTCPRWTVIPLPFKRAACKRIFPNPPPPADGMTMMLLQSTQPSCVLQLHSMQTLTHSIQDTAIKVNPTSHMWTCWASSIWKGKSWVDFAIKTNCTLLLTCIVSLTLHLFSKEIITFGTLAFNKMYLCMYFHSNDFSYSFSTISSPSLKTKTKIKTKSKATKTLRENDTGGNIPILCWIRQVFLPGLIILQGTHLLFIMSNCEDDYDCIWWRGSLSKLYTVDKGWTNMLSLSLQVIK